MRENLYIYIATPTSINIHDIVYFSFAWIFGPWANVDFRELQADRKFINILDELYSIRFGSVENESHLLALNIKE